MAHNKGFTLIELMIAVAIVGILAALAVPTYNDYTTRARISEALQFAAAAKISVVEFHIANGRLPNNQTESGVANVTSAYVGAVQYEKDSEGAAGRIIITLSDAVGADAAGKRFVMEATPQTGGFLKWVCKPATTNGVAEKMLPASCRGASG